MSPRQKTAPKVERVRALLVGAQDYIRKDQIVSLSCARNDALALRSVLVDSLGWPRENITVLAKDVTADDPPTWENIRRHLGNQECQMEMGDIFLFFFSGHGIERKNETFLLPEDAYLRPWYDGRHRVISVDDIAEVFSSPSVSQANRILWLDCCRRHVDAGAKGGVDSTTQERMVRDLEARLLDGPDIRANGPMAIFFACDQNQFANESTDAGHGLFCLSLLEALKKLAPSERYISHDRLKQSALDSIHTMRRMPPWQHIEDQLPLCLNPRDTPFIPSFKARDSGHRRSFGTAGAVPAPAGARWVRSTTSSGKTVPIRHISGCMYAPAHADVLIPMMRIPEGIYPIGSESYDNARPLITKEVKSFYIELFPVLLSEVKQFASRTGGFGAWLGTRIPRRLIELHNPAALLAAARGCGHRDLFAGNVDYFEARAFCEQHGMRLPMEHELEVALSALKNRTAGRPDALPEEVRWADCEELRDHIRAMGLHEILDARMPGAGCLSPLRMSVREMTSSIYADSYAAEMHTETWGISVPTLGSLIDAATRIVVRGQTRQIASRQPMSPFERSLRVVFRRVLPADATRIVT